LCLKKEGANAMNKEKVFAEFPLLNSEKPNEDLQIKPPFVEEGSFNF